MKKKSYLFPWEKKIPLTCPRCNGTIQTNPLWPWEKPEDKIRELQRYFCHTIDLSLIKQAQVLTENDAKCAKKLEEYRKEFLGEGGKMKTHEELNPLFIVENGPPEIFLRHGLFPLLALLTETGRKILYLFLCMSAEKPLLPQRFFKECLNTSRANVSSIIMRLKSWRLMTTYKINVKGRANGRQLCFSLSAVARQRLDKDLLEYDCFRETVGTTVRPLARSYSYVPWRTDLGLLDRENEQKQTAGIDKSG